MYLALALIFFTTLAAGLIVSTSFIFKFESRARLAQSYGAWLILYFLFIALGTGPKELRVYTQQASPYKLPWKAGISHLVSQGNRSFTSHRDVQLFAWDFWMSIGTQVLAARAGTVLKVVQSFDGIGFDSNYVMIEHNDGTRAMYAHIRRGGSVVQSGDYVEQGQFIAYSGLVGQTINPHLHFVVLDKFEKMSLPITFSDVPNGVPLAGRLYESGNFRQ